MSKVWLSPLFYSKHCSDPRLRQQPTSRAAASANNFQQPMHNTKLHPHFYPSQATNSSNVTSQQQQFARRTAQATSSAHESGFSTKAPQPEPLPSNPLHHGFPNHPQIPTGARVVDISQDAVLAQNIALGAAILRLKIPHMMPCVHITANGTLTVTWNRVSGRGEMGVSLNPPCN